MAKRSLNFREALTDMATASPTKQPKTTPLSPGNITAPNQHATVSAVVASLSPIKPNKYFDGELTDGECVIRLVGFDKSKQRQLQMFCDSKMPVTLRDCQVQLNKFKSTLEVVLKKHTKIEPSQLKFDVSDMKTVGSSQINLPDQSEHDRVTVKVSVLKVYEQVQVGAGKTKQEVLVADSTGQAIGDPLGE